ncbi:MAG: VOC family protein [Sulfitobacter sp.]
MPQPIPTLIGLDHLVLTVACIPTTVTFYETVLGMRAESFATADGQTRWALKFGQAKINLHEVGREFEPKAATPTPGSADLCFLTQTPIGEWVTHLQAQGILIEEGPVPRTGAQAPLTSLYVRDPDQNLIEIAIES